MNEEALTQLRGILELPAALLDENQKAILKGRVSYLTPEEIARYPFLKGTKVKQQLPKDVYKPPVPERKEEVITEMVTAANKDDMSEERIKKLSDKSFLESGGADPDFNSSQTAAAKVQNDKIEEKKEELKEQGTKFEDSPAKTEEKQA